MAKSKGKTPDSPKVETYKGLNKKRIEAGGGGAGQRLKFEAGETVAVQFLTDPDDFSEYYIHSFREDGQWRYVPCAGKKECALCQDEDSDKAARKYHFACNVYNLKEKKVQVLEGGKEIATSIFFRYSRKPKSFTKRVYEITRFDGTRTTYDVTPGEDEAVKTDKLKLVDLENYLNEQLKRYWGEDMPTESAMDDDDDEEDDESDDDEDEDEEDDDDDNTLTADDVESMDIKQLISVAKDRGIKYKGAPKKAQLRKLILAQLDDEDEEDDDDEDDDEEEGKKEGPYTEDDLDELDEDELEDIAEKFDIDTDDYDEWDDVREAILEAQEKASKKGAKKKGKK